MLGAHLTVPGPGHALLVEVNDASGPDMSGKKGGLEHLVA